MSNHIFCRKGFMAFLKGQMSIIIETIIVIVFSNTIDF